MKISIIAFVAILLQLVVVVNGQFQILFTKDYIKVHSKRTVDYSLHLRLAHDHAKHLEDDFTHDHGLRDAAKSCATLIRYHADFHDLLFNQTLYRDERGITALWEIWSAVSGAPDPQDWDNQKTLMKDLISLQNDEQAEIKLLKKKLKYTQRSVTDDKIRMDALVRKIVNNEIKEDELVQHSFVAQSLCYQGLTLSLELRDQNDIIHDVTLNAKSQLPSRYMFPADEIKKVVENHTLYDKVSRPVFLTDREINQLYSLKSTISTYDSKANTIHSLISIPLCDYSTAMASYPIPVLNQKDGARMHKIELVLMRKIDVYLCSETQHSVRFFSTQSLPKCQSHDDLHRKSYICENRHILISGTTSTCSNLRELPKAIVIDISSEFFLFDHPVTVAKLFCQNSTDIVTHDVAIPNRLTKIKVPLECSLETEFVSISRVHMDDATLNLENPDIKVFNVDDSKYDLPDDLGEMLKSTTPMTSSTEPSSEQLNNLERKVDQDMKKASRDFAQARSFHSDFSTIQIVVAIIAASSFLTSITLLVLKCKKNAPKFRKRSRNPTSNSESIELRNSDILKRLEKLENKTKEYEQSFGREKKTVTNKMNDLRTSLRNLNFKQTDLTYMSEKLDEAYERVKAIELRERDRNEHDSKVAETLEKVENSVINYGKDLKIYRIQLCGFAEEMHDYDELVSKFDTLQDSVDEWKLTVETALEKLKTQSVLADQILEFETSMNDWKTILVQALEKFSQNLANFDTKVQAASSDANFENATKALLESVGELTSSMKDSIDKL